MKKKSARAGFTLLEILVATAVLAVIMLLVYKFFAQAIFVWQRQSARTEALSSSRAALEHISSRLRESDTIWVAEEKSIAFSQWPANSTTVDSNTVGLWHIDEGTGTTIANSSSLGAVLNGTIPEDVEVAVSDEEFTIPNPGYGEWVELAHNYIKVDSETVANGEPYTAGTDYSMWPAIVPIEGTDYHTEGYISALAGGGMAEGSSYQIDYTYLNRGPAWEMAEDLPVPGYRDVALLFNSHSFDTKDKDDAITIPDHAAFDLEEMTLGMYFSPGEDIDGSQTSEIVLWQKDTGTPALGNAGLHWKAGDGRLYFYLDDGSSDTEVFSATTTWTADTWYYVAAAYGKKYGEETKVMNLYVGKLQYDTDKGEYVWDFDKETADDEVSLTTVLGTSAPLYIGSSGTGSGFKGIIDEIRLSDIPRPQPLNEYAFSGTAGEDLTWYYNKAREGEETGPVAKGVEEFKIEYLKSDGTLISAPVPAEQLMDIETVYFHLKTAAEDQESTLATKIYPRNI